MNLSQKKYFMTNDKAQAHKSRGTGYCLLPGSNLPASSAYFTSTNSPFFT